MAFVETLDPAAPADSDLLSLGDDSIRQLKRALIERLNTLVTDINTNPLALQQSKLISTEKRRFSAGDWVVVDNSNPAMTRSTFNIAIPAGVLSFLMIAVTKLQLGQLINHVRLSGVNSGTGGTLTAVFDRTTAAGVTTTLATLTMPSGAGTQVIEAALGAIVVADGDIFGFQITVSQTATSTISMNWVEVDPA